MNRLLPRLLAGPMILLGGLLAVSQLSAQTGLTPKDKTAAKDVTAPTTTPTEPKTSFTEKKATNKHVLEAEELFRSNKPDKAFEKLKEAVKSDATLPPEELMMARLWYSAQGGAQNGRNLLEFCLAKYPQHPEVYLTNAAVALGEGRVFETLLNCQIALGRGKDFNVQQRKDYKKESRAGLTQANEARRNWAEARTNLEAWSELDPDNSQVKQRLARAYFLLDKYDDFDGAWAQALKLDSKLDFTEIARAQLHASQVGAMGEAPADDPAKAKDIAAHDKKHKELAKDYFVKGIKNHPKLARAHTAYAGWLLDTGDRDEARKQIEEAATIEGAGKESRETLALQGLLARYEEEWAVAEEKLIKLLSIEPGDFFGGNLLALVMAENNKLAKAEQYAQVNARQYGRSAEAHATLAYIFFKENKLKEAEQEIALAVNSGQASADTAYYLALILDAKGGAEKKDEHYTEAYKVLKKAVDSKGVFVNRKKADDLLKSLKAKAPPEKASKEK